MQDDLRVKVAVEGTEEANRRVDSVRERFKDTGKDASDLSQKLQTAGLVVASFGAALTVASKKATDATVDHVRSVMSLARVTGESVEDTSRMRYALERSGIAADQAGSIFGILSKRIQDANEKSGEAALKQADLRNKIDAAKLKIQDLTAEQGKAGAKSAELDNQIQALNISIQQYEKQLGDTVNPLQKLGIETQTAEGKSRDFNDVLLDIADKFKSMPDGAEKTALALELFGRSGKNMLGFLNRGSKGIEDLMKKADELGITIGQDNVDAVLKYVEAQKKLKDAQQQVTIAIGSEALPMWQKLADMQVLLVEKFQGLPQPVRQAAASVIAFGGPILATAGTLLTFGSSLTDVTGKSLPELTKKLRGAGGAGGGFIGTIVSIATKLGIWGLVIGAVVGGLALMQTNFGALNPIIEGASNVWQSLSDNWNTNVLPALQKLWEWFSIYILPVLQEIWGFVGGQLLAAWNSLAEAFGNVMNALAPLMPVLQLLGLLLGGMIIGALLLVVGAVTAVVVVLATFINIVAKVIAWIWNLNAALINGIGQAINWVIGKVSGFGRWFGDRFWEARNGAVNAINSLLGWFGGINLYNSGWNMINSFGNGIVNAFDRVKGWVSGKMGDLRKLFPFSPAKEGPFSGTGYTSYSGRALMTDFGRGILDGASSAIGATSSALGRVSDLFGVGPSSQMAMSGSGGGSYMTNGNPLASGSSSRVEYSGDTRNVTNQFTGQIVLQTKEAADAFMDRIDEDANFADIGVPT